MCSVEFKAWSWSAQFRVDGMECGMYSVERKYKVRSAPCTVQSVVYKVQSVKCKARSFECKVYV